MRKFFPIFLLILIFSIGASAQNKDSLTQKEKKSIISLDHRVRTPNPLYIIRLDDKQFEYRNNNEVPEYSPLKDLKPEWVKNVDVLRSKEGIEKYGPRAEEGVIIVVLKKKSWRRNESGATEQVQVINQDFSLNATVVLCS